MTRPRALSQRRTTRRRIAAAFGLSAVVVAGLSVHAFLPDSAGTDIAGDALYAIAPYLAVVIVAPRLSPLAVGALAAAWCVAVELFQLTDCRARWRSSLPRCSCCGDALLDDGAAAVLVLVHGGVAAPFALSSARVTGDQPSRAA